VPVPNVQWIIPEDGQRNCPKHVEFRTRINLEISASFVFYCKEICYDARSYERKKKIYLYIFTLYRNLVKPRICFVLVVYSKLQTRSSVNFERLCV